VLFLQLFLHRAIRVWELPGFCLKKKGFLQHIAPVVEQKHSSRTEKASETPNFWTSLAQNDPPKVVCSKRFQEKGDAPVEKMWKKLGPPGGRFDAELPDAAFSVRPHVLFRKIGQALRSCGTAVYAGNRSD
jgi:hypothetical protein